MRYFVNLENMCKYATNSEIYINIFSKNEAYLEVTKAEFEELEDKF